MKFSIKDFLRKCDQIRWKLRIRSHLLKKSLMENLIFCSVAVSKFVIKKIIKKLPKWENFATFALDTSISK